jgi:hypothetical protein
MAEQQNTEQTLQAEIRLVEEQLAQREKEAQRFRRELEAVENQGAQGSSVRGELQQADEDIDALRQRLTNLQAQVSPPVAHPPDHTPLTGGAGIGIGSVAWVAQEGGASTHLRTHPHFERGEDVTRITSGMQFTVLDGPEYEEGYTWWRVRTTDGREGWVPDEGLMGQNVL